LRGEWSGVYSLRIGGYRVLYQIRGNVQVNLVPDVEKGEVLVDSRGRGTFQKAR
jgi:mRNA-degrading endonuclease RelE of RelBE toxin-antitoxin system